MRALSFVLVALLLASVSHQGLVSFGEFKGGAHEQEEEEDSRTFKLTFSTIQGLEYFVKYSNLYVTSLNSS